jgi:hypothetical protein
MKNYKTAFVGAGLTLALLAGGATGAQAGQERNASRLSQAGTGTGASAGTGSSSSSERTTVAYAWKVDNAGVKQDVTATRVTEGPDAPAQWTVKVNGQEVPPERFDVQGETLIVRDEAGKELLRKTLGPVNVYKAGEGAMWPQVRVIDREGLDNDSPFAGRPRVRMGITMQTAGDELVSHLGLAEGEYALVSTVSPGSAAEAAGMQAHDLIVSVDGQKPASIETIREVLQTKKVGDTMKVVVKRKGAEQALTLTFQTSGKQDVPAEWSRPLPLQENCAQLDAVKQEMEAARRAMEEAGRNMGQDGAAMAERYAQLVQRMRNRGGLAMAAPMGPDGAPGELEIFTKPNALMAWPESSLDELKARVESMNAKLTELEAVLKRMDERLAQLSTREIDRIKQPNGGGGSSAPKPHPERWH